LEQKRAELLQNIEQNQVEIWPEHQHACTLFFAMASQWTISTGMAGVIFHGLKYEVLDAVQRRQPPDWQLDAPDDATLFAQLQILEREALRHLNAER